ncbi:MAG: hypothetical protein HY260_18575 [Chloroflexi bacterium]|nr:hypothetical protein [Chloroflexota bacterium]
MPRIKIDPALAIGVGIAVVAIVALGPLAVAWLGRSNSSPDVSREIVFTIPPGTAELIKAGGDPKIVPAEILFTLGLQDVLVIHNQDVTGHTFGPYWVAAHDTLRVQFSNPVEYEGYCSVHPSKQVKIVVRAASP